MIYKIDEAAQKAINDYLNLDIEGKYVQSPYFINTNRKRDLRALVGKGTPQEMLMEARIWEKLKGVNFLEMSEQDLKSFLSDRGIGIDCSGFVTHVLNYSYKSKHNKSIWSKFKIPSYGIFSTLKYILRPVENLGAEVITSLENCIKIDLKNVMPGDLIRSKSIKLNGHHIMIVTEVEKADNIKVSKVTYVHSSPHFNENNGVKYGEIVVAEENNELQLQEWTEKDIKGNVPTLEGFLMNLEDNGLRRLKFSKELE